MTVEELLDGWLAAWSSKNRGAFAPLCVTDVSYEDPLCPEPLEGAAAISAHAGRLWAAFPDARVERTGSSLTDTAPGPGDGTDLEPAATFAAVPCKLVATHRAELEGLPASGRFVVLHCVFYCSLRHGRLARVRAFFDLYDAATQIGVLPNRGTLGEKALLVLRGFGLSRRPR